jgi:hypothetical protein
MYDESQTGIMSDDLTFRAWLDRGESLPADV